MPRYVHRKTHFVNPNSSHQVQGYACVFNTPVRVNEKTRSFSRGCFEMDLIRRTDVRVVIGHRGQGIASVRDGSLRLWEDECGLAFSADIPRGWNFRDLAQSIALGKTGCSIQYLVVKTREDESSVVASDLDLVHIALTPDPALPTACWLCNFDLMLDPPALLKELRQKWLDGQCPPSREPFPNRKTKYPFLIWEGYL